MKPLSAGDPAQVGPYRLLGVLGAGGMGRVYLGQSRAGRRVAIKVIRSELAEDPGFRLRFTREVSAARLVSPLYTAAVVDADPDAELPWLATTYIEGPSLEERVRRSGPMSPAAVLTLAVGLAEALESIHAVGLVHRDLKPSNVLIHDSGPHIIDFGIALADGDSRMTTSLVVGTPSFMAPERIHGSEAGPAGDVFSLGATLVFAATGRGLVPDGSMYAQIMQMTVGRFDLSDVPAPLRPLLVRCTSRRPAERPTAEELTRILAASGVAAPAPGWHSSTADAPEVTLPTLGLRMSRRTALFLAGATVTAGAAGIAAWQLRPADGSPAAISPSRSPSPLPSRAGHLLWRVNTGTLPSDAAQPTPPGGSRVVVVGGLIVATDGRAVFGIDTEGIRLWTTPLSDGPVSLCRRGSAVVAFDANRLWVLDPADGRASSEEEVAERERLLAATDNADGLPAQVRALTLWAATTYLNLGTAMVALSEDLFPLWRTPRPASVNGRRPRIGNPVAASLGALIATDVQGSTMDVAYYNRLTGANGWTTRYAHEPSPGGPRGPGGGPGGPGGPGEPDGIGPSGGPNPQPPNDDRHDEAWDRVEGRIIGDALVLRDAHQIHALNAVDGTPLWNYKSDKPVASIEVSGPWVLVGADQVRGLTIAKGEQRWAQGSRGGRLAAVGVDQAVAVGEQEVALLRSDGKVIWQEALGNGLRDAAPEYVVVEGGVVYAAFKPRPGRSPLEFDVVAYRL